MSCFLRSHFLPMLAPSLGMRFWKVLACKRPAATDDCTSRFSFIVSHQSGVNTHFVDLTNSALESTLSWHFLNNITPTNVGRSNRLFRMTSKPWGRRTSLRAKLHHNSWDVEPVFTHYIEKRGKSNRSAVNAALQVAGSRTEFHSTLHKALKLKPNCLQHHTTKRWKSDRVPLNRTPKTFWEVAVISGQVSKRGYAFRRWLLQFQRQTWPSKAPESWQQRQTTPRKFSNCKSSAIFCAHVK